MFTDGQVVVVFPKPRQDSGNDTPFAGMSDIARRADYIFIVEVEKGHIYLRCRKDRFDSGRDLEVAEVID